MTALTDRAIKSTYTDLLQVSNSGNGVDASLRNVSDGEGTASALELSTTSAKIQGDLVITGDLSANTVSGSALGNIVTAATAAQVAASSSATAAATSATNSATSATASATSATASATSATASAASASAAAADLATFQGQYHGASATAPTTGLDTGDLYFDTVADAMKVYNGSSWVAAYISAAGVLTAANNLSDVSSASASRTNLGLGTMATQAATGVDIDGGTIDGATIGGTSAGAVTATTLTATDASVISVSSSSDALRITQTGAGNALLVEDSTNPDSTPFVVDASGNVGIGTSSPLSTLDVDGALTVRNNIGGPTTNFAVSIGANPLASITDGGNVVLFGSTAAGAPGSIFLNTPGSGYLAVATASTERLRVNAAGDVGIGTSSPSTKLHVNGTITIGTSNQSYGAGVLGYSDANYGYVFRPPQAGGVGAYLFEASDGTDLVSITEGGNVGIGRNPTTNKLEVAGTIESTSGGFKFPDGSTQTKSAGHGLSAMIALGMA